MIAQRKNSNRLQGYDYSLAGAYFLTLVTKGRDPLFGHLNGEIIKLNAIGKIVAEEWDVSAGMRKELRIDQFIVMPNHLHAILFIDDLQPLPEPRLQQAVGAHGRAPLLHRNPRSLGSLVAAYKAASTRRIREFLVQPEYKAWQRNYYDRIIRNQNELEKIRDYIRYNPLLLSQRGEGLWK